MSIIANSNNDANDGDFGRIGSLVIANDNHDADDYDGDCGGIGSLIDGVKFHWLSIQQNSTPFVSESYRHASGLTIERE